MGAGREGKGVVGRSKEGRKGRTEWEGGTGRQGLRARTGGGEGLEGREGLEGVREGLGGRDTEI